MSTQVQTHEKTIIFRAQVEAEATADPLTDESIILDTATDPKAEELAKAVTTITAAIAKLADDPGAIFEEEVRSAWNLVFDQDQAEYVRQREAAKKSGASKIEIDKMVGARNKRVREKAQNYFHPNPSDSSESKAKPTHNPSETHPNPSSTHPKIGPGALVEYDQDGKPRRVIDSQAADIVAYAMREHLAWDGEAGSWLVWEGTHWKPQETSAHPDRLLADAVYIGTDPLGYRMAYLNGITQIMQRRGLLAPRPAPHGLIPFRNGLLDLHTMDLTPATPDRALTWCLPHDYAPGADCPTIKAWLLRSVEGDAETVELLRAWLAALVRGLPLQKFLLLLGRGGSGKGTYQRLATALVGVRNVAISSLRDLEENRFETAKLYGKRLCSINEAGKHGGALNMLKALTGGDHIPLERKHVQQSGSFVFSGLVLMATNEDLQTTDTTSGLERRRITVRFPVSATPEEKANWEARGGEEAVLHTEIPGLVNWLLELPAADIRQRFDHPPMRVVTDNLLGMAAGNSVADWLIQATVPEPDAWSQIGTKQERRSMTNGAVYFEHADEWLYPSYLTWCLAHGRSRPVSVVKFRSTVADIAETLGHPLKQDRHPVTRAASLVGLRFRNSSDSDGLWGGSDELSYCSESNGWVDAETLSETFQKKEKNNPDAVESDPMEDVVEVSL